MTEEKISLYRAIVEYWKIRKYYKKLLKKQKESEERYLKVKKGIEKFKLKKIQQKKIRDALPKYCGYCNSILIRDEIYCSLCGTEI